MIREALVLERCTGIWHSSQTWKNVRDKPINVQVAINNCANRCTVQLYYIVPVRGLHQHLCLHLAPFSRYHHFFSVRDCQWLWAVLQFGYDSWMAAYRSQRPPWVMCLKTHQVSSGCLNIYFIRGCFLDTETNRCVCVGCFIYACTLLYTDVRSRWYSARPLLPVRRDVRQTVPQRRGAVICLLPFSVARFADLWWQRGA